jgi:hypothetical protein
MKKTELNKNARRMILQEGLTHQGVFDELVQKSQIDKDKLAELIAVIPSKNKLSQNKVWINAMIVVLGVVILLRILSIWLFAFVSDWSPVLLLFAIIVGIVVPVVGIYASLTSRFDMYKGLGILMGLSILRSFKDNSVQDYQFFLVLIPFIGAVALAFYIPYRLKVNYNRVVKEDEHGNKTAHYQFDKDPYFGSAELVDDM